VPQTTSQPERRKTSSNRLDLPARSTERIKFGRDFGKRFMIFVDTEEEFDWTEPRSRDATSTSAVRHLPEFQTLMDAHGAAPCYLIDYPVAANAESADVLRMLLASGRCSVGTQLHPWVNPPFDEDVVTHNSFAGNLPVELERAKLTVLTDKIEAAVGCRPVSYRAGRYGIGPNTSDLLGDLGYRVDTSVRPGFDYSHEGGPSFLRHDARPYWGGPDGMLIELPLGATYTGQLRRYGRWIVGDGRSNPRRIAALSRFGLCARVALTPEDMPLKDVERAIGWMVRDGIQLFSFSFHSPSLVPGNTPYVRNSGDLNDFYRWWDRIFTVLASYGITPASLDDVIEAAWGARAEPRR
jgi:hypothetical protein